MHLDVVGTNTTQSYERMGVCDVTPYCHISVVNHPYKGVWGKQTMRSENNTNRPQRLVI